MNLSRIYACKLYLTSSRKDSIKAAINDSKNMALVQQLSEYLDDDAKDKLAEAVEDKLDKKNEQSNDKKDAVESIPDENNVFSPSYSESRPASPSVAPSASSSDEMDFDVDKLSFDDEVPSEPETTSSDNGSETPVEESTSVHSTVTADTAVSDSESVIFNIANEASVIKGTLNSNETTSGVQRVTVNDKELWIFYEDKSNIGDIMIDVIEALNASGYTYLSFSRLARSNNAIVFDIEFNLNEPIKTKKEIEENFE